MKSETRTNLLFLALFLAVSLPGAVILFRKKLDPSAPRMDQPDPVVRRLPFMSPPPWPPGVVWTVPPITFAWLNERVHQRAGTSLLSATSAGPRWDPVISEDHRLQVAAICRARVTLVLWNDQIKDPKSFSLAAQRIPGQEHMDARIASIDPVDLPADLRRELVAFGYSRPPGHVIWAAAELTPPPGSGAHVRLVLVYSGSPSPLHIPVEFVVR